MRYQTFSTGSSNINTVSSYIRSELGVSFYGRWMLVAEWNGVPQYDESRVSSVMIIIPLAHFTIAMNILQFTTNTFQGVIITDGSTSYAVFLYYCPSMEWSGNAVIGWQASRYRYRNHPLSGTSDAKQVACLNTATSSYNTVVFKLSSVSKLEPVHVTAYMYSICLSALCIDHSLSYHTHRYLHQLFLLWLF